MKQEGSLDATSRARHTTMLSRDFDFPRAKVFDMMIDPKKAVKWFGTPAGAVKVDFQMDPRPGGVLKIHDRNSEGLEGKTSGTFVEIVAPEKISFKTGTKMTGVAAPFEALQTMIFEEVGPTKTRLTIVVEVLNAGSFAGGAEGLADGYKGGWGETLDMLQRELQAPA